MTDDDAPEPRRPRWKRRVAAVAILAALLSPWWGPPALRPLAFFRVRHVEVRGWRFAAPGRIAERLGIDTTFSIWNDLAPLRKRVLAYSEVQSVEISRRLPATIVVTITENQPVALVAGASGFRVYDAGGKHLPIDPSRTPVDLPVLERADTALLRLLGDIKAQNPGFFARVSDVRRAGPDEVVLHLTHLTVRARPDVSIERLAQISSVEQDLALRHLNVTELDLRFRDQVIARLP